MNGSPRQPNDADNAMWRLGQWFPDLPENIHTSLKTYHSELLKFNGKLNLISRATEREADEIHFADSLSAVQMILATGIKSDVYDVGSGNGLPGVVLGVVSPSTKVFLVESDMRKGEFLKHIIHTLHLSNVSVLSARLESLKDTDIQVGVARGFASIAKTLLVCNRLFAKGGRFFHLKGATWSREIADIPSQLISVWAPELIGEYSLPVSQARRAVVCTTKTA